MTQSAPKKVTRIIQLAGGKIVGRTRLQKTSCLLEMTGLGEGFSFSYHLYGPYSDEISVAISDAALLGYISEESRSTSWGSRFSIFKSDSLGQVQSDSPEARLASLAAKADGIALELAVTAAFLAQNGVEDPWSEVKRRKPEKVGSIRAAKDLYREFLAVDTPVALPRIV